MINLTPPLPDAPERKETPASLLALEPYLPTLTGLAAFLFYLFISGRHHVDRDYFVPLANALLHGHLDVGRLPAFMDELAPSHGTWYVVFPFMPALLTLPWFVGARELPNQLWPCLWFGALNAALCYTLVHALTRSPGRALAFAALFAFGTVHWYGASDGGAWHYAQITALTFLFLALNETFRKGRAGLMGVWLGGAMLCRIDTVMAFPFFAAFLLQRALPTGVPLKAAWSALDTPRLLRDLAAFAAGLGVFVAAYLAYNALRFDSPIETGYRLIPGVLLESWYRDGIFNLQHVPRNLHAMLFTGPGFRDRAPYFLPPHFGGMSLFLTTPAFLWALKTRKADTLWLGAWLAVVGVATPILLHGEPGGAQFGFRYAMDLYPFLLLLAAWGMGERMSLEARVAIALSVLVNLWGVWGCMTGNWA